MSSFQLDAELMKSVVAKAIFDTMTPETREGVISAAVASLLEQPKDKNYYGDKKSELQSIFENTARIVAGDVIREKLGNDKDFRAKVESLFARAAELAFAGENFDKLASKMAEQLVEGLKLDRY